MHAGIFPYSQFANPTVSGVFEPEIVSKLDRREQKRGEIVDIGEGLRVDTGNPVLVAGQIQISVKSTPIDAFVEVGTTLIDDFSRPCADFFRGGDRKHGRNLYSPVPDVLAV